MRSLRAGLCGPLLTGREVGPLAFFVWKIIDAEGRRTTACVRVCGCSAGSSVLTGVRLGPVVGRRGGSRPDMLVGSLQYR